jgi:glycosyltransferase involved in cell wall biosynthesis
MHILFVHRKYPGQFGHVAHHLVKHYGFECTFACESASLPPGTPAGAGHVEGVRLIPYPAQQSTRPPAHFSSQPFEDAICRCHAVYETLKAHPLVKPDLVVGFSSFGSTLFLLDLYRCPIINYFEYFHPPRGSALDFRPDFPPPELQRLRALAYNAMNLLNLQGCTAGYSPMEWQRSLHPAEYQHKLTTIFDGIDRNLWRRRVLPRRIGDRAIPPETRIVTHISSRMDPNRGFDLFMKTAKRIYQQRRDVLFVVVGTDAPAAGPGPRGTTFREHVLAQDSYDLGRFLFTGRIPEEQLAEILSLSDLHLYWTVPFVLSWSLMDALACGCTILASDTPPVSEVIGHEQNGLLAGFFDVDAFARQALRVLADPEAFRPLGQAGVSLIDEKYSLGRTIPLTIEFYRRVLESKRH